MYLQLLANLKNAALGFVTRINANNNRKCQIFKVTTLNWYRLIPNISRKHTLCNMDWNVINGILFQRCNTIIENLYVRLYFDNFFGIIEPFFRISIL